LTCDQEVRVHALAVLKRALEDGPMTKPEFVYVTYIETTPERLWQALTDPAFTRRYWRVEFVTDWTEGAPMTWRQGEAETTDPEQRVLVSDPYRRLSYTWHTFTPAWAKAVGMSEEDRAAMAAEPRSKVTFDIEPADSGVRLTVTHDDLDPGGIVLDKIKGGWPHVVSRLKTLLESGEPL
jgi:uncharacterized protein YndB with AHSA1/START domain